MSLGSSIFRPRLIFFVQLVMAIAAWGWFPQHATAQEPSEPGTSDQPMVRGSMVPGYARLAEPEVADQLDLSDEQRAQVATILRRRAAALETASDDQRRAILEASETELASLLDDDQLARWLALAGEVTKKDVKLRFNFRFTPWADVLSWFAERSGLSLVLDAPPPGTFNYIDTKEYTPAEAIDLLNGVLLTKGYTLIRRERMLLAIDIADGVPEELVPEIDLKDLDTRGRFELVRVTFPLGTRDAALVEAEIKPLLGEFGKSIPLPQTKQLVVIETAGKVRAIRAVIDSIPEPAKPAPAARQKKPEKPTLATYPLKNIDPAAALKTLETLFGAGHFVHDSKTNRLIAYVGPSQQTAVAKTLEQMQAETPEEMKFDLEIHRLASGDHAPLITLLQTLFPDARLSLDAASSSLVAWATPPEQETIRRTIVGLDEEGATPGERKLKVYRLRRSDPSTLVSLLTSVLPRARITADAPSKSIAVLANESEHMAVAAAVDAMEAAPDDTTQPSARFYPVPRDQVETLQPLLTSLVPQAQIRYDNARETFVVVAVPEDHETVAKTIASVVTDAPETEQPRLESYEVPAKRRAAVVAALAAFTNELPGIQTLPDTNDDRMLIWARPKQHAVIGELISQVTEGIGAEQQAKLVAYPLEFADAATIVSVLQTIVPQAQLVVESTSNQIVAWANSEDQEKLRGAIKQVDIEAPPRQRLRLMSHPIKKADKAAVIQVLQTLVPSMKLIDNPAANTIIALGIETDQKLLDETIDRMQPSDDPDSQYRVEVYPLHNANAQAYVNALTPAFPRDSFTADVQGGRLIAWATAEDHATILEAVERLERPFAEGEEPEAVVHRLEHITPAVAVAALQPLFPTARLQAEPANRSVVAMASPDDQESIRTMLAQLDLEPYDDRRTLAVYSLDGADAASALTLLQTAFVEARVTSNPKTDSLLVWAKADEHKKIQEMIESLRLPEDDRPRAVVYRLEHITPAVAVGALRPLFPQTQLQSEPQIQSVVVVANKLDQEAIRATLEQLDTKPRDNDPRTLVVYSLDGADAASALTLLQTAFVEARVTSNPKTDSLLVWAKADEHEQIQKMIESLRLPADDRPGPVVHRLEYITPAVAVAALRPLFPQAQLQSEPQNQSVVVVANRRDQEAIRATLDQLDVKQRDDRRQLVAYPLDGAEATAALTLLQTAFTDARIISDPKTDSLLVWAKPEDHASIRETIDALVREVPEERQSITRSYILQNTDASVALGVLRPLVPTALMAVDTRGRKLLVTAVPEDQVRVEAAIAELETAPADDLAESLRIYDVENADASVVLKTLQQLYAQRSEVRLSLDPLTNKIAAWASPKQHESIAEVVAKFDELLDPSEELQVEVYPLGGADPSTVGNVLSDLFAQRPEVKIMTDEATEQLIVLAQADDQTIVKKTIDQLQTSKLAIDVIQLRFVDPYSAELAIETLFSTSGRGRKRGHEPRVDSDPATGQLFIRGTPEQLSQIRELLAKMGETFVADQTLGSGRKLRVIPLPNGTVNETLEEVRRVWSQLQSNPIRVVTPSAIAPTLRKLKENRQKARREEEEQEDSNATPEEPGSEEQTRSQTSVPEAILAQVVSFVEDNQDDAEPNLPQSGEAPDMSEQENGEGAGGFKEKPPIVIAIGKDNLTIASEDVEALDQFETLLKTIVQRVPPGGRQFTVFALTTANAALVAESLEKLFEDGLFGFRGSSNVTIVPDQRLNALIVQASAADLATIEGLIKVLDTNEPLDSMVRTEPRVIKVERAKARDIELVLRDVYKTQLTTGGTRPQLNVPRGSSREVRNVLQQLNATAAGPEMTLSVDTETNSIIVLAAQPLFEEVRQLVEQLDKAADQPNRIVRVVPLKQTNTRIVQKTLDSLLKEVQRQRRRSR